MGGCPADRRQRSQTEVRPGTAQPTCLNDLATAFLGMKREEFIFGQARIVDRMQRGESRPKNGNLTEFRNGTMLAPHWRRPR
jgi:hypothetical protein